MEQRHQRAIEAEISRVIVRYCRAFDEGRFDEVADLYTADATWQRPGHALLQGTQIRAFCVGTSASVRFKHVTSNILVDVVDEDNARAATSVLVFIGDAVRGVPSPLSGVSIVGDYHDAFRRVGGEWRIAHRETIYAFAAA